MSGIAVSVNVSKNKGEVKTPTGEALVTLKGIEGDAHSGDWHRQVSLMSREDIDGFDASLPCGAFAENITTRGIDLSLLQINDKIKVGESVILTLTQIGKKCHSGCAIQQRTGKCIMPEKGLFFKVETEGKIREGDAVVKL